MRPQKTFYQQEVERIAARHALPERLYMQVRHSRWFMEHYHAENIRLADMAAAACMSRFHYIRVFQRIYGISPRQHLQDLRMARAKQLIRTGVSVTRTCIDVGYASLPTFSSTFKRATGLSPHAYRKRQMSNPE